MRTPEWCLHACICRRRVCGKAFFIIAEVKSYFNFYEKKNQYRNRGSARAPEIVSELESNMSKKIFVRMPVLVGEARHALDVLLVSRYNL